MPTQSSATIVSDTKTKPKPSIATYGLPPDGWKESNHFFHYGWPVTIKIMRSALLKLSVKLPKPCLYPGILCSRLELVLKFQGVNAILVKPDKFCETEGRAFTSKENGQRYVMFITIGCTCSRKYFWRRPDPETLQEMIKIIGEEPRWMENAMTKQEFRPGLLAY